MTSEEGLGVNFFPGKICWGKKGRGGCDNSPPALRRCLTVPAASAGAGIERLNLQQGRFHLDIKRKLFSSKAIKHQHSLGGCEILSLLICKCKSGEHGVVWARRIFLSVGRWIR